ncbi:MAG: LytR/AlgR family response regulator transcription factor [Crocinitomicaceae bacterium]
MREFRTLIIDDERLAREELKSLLKEFNEIEIIGEAQNGEEGIQKVKDLNPDLIFLDVSMPEMTGFEMLKQLGDIPNVIFVTAYDQYALKAFEVNALDYVLKPVETERLEDAIKKLKEREDNDFESENTLNHRKDRQLTIEDRVFVKDNEKCYFVRLGDIRMLESDGNYVKVYFGESRPLILRSLNSFEEKLDPEVFFRANRKFIVNLQFVQKVENWFNGGLQFELASGDKIEVSRRQAIRFKEHFAF